MKKFKVSILLVLALLLTGCGSSSTNKGSDGSDDPIKVVASFTIIADMAEQIGGDLLEVYTLVPSGTDPHEYEPKPNDIKAATDADVLLYNGINLEGGQDGWFFKMVRSINKSEDIIYELAKGVEPKYLMEGNSDSEVNPHAFIDPHVGMIMAKNLTEALISIDPENKDLYEKNHDTYLTRLMEIDKKYQETIDAIPIENRILITSELAFQYMTDRYGLREASVWEIDTEELGTSEQLRDLINYIKNDSPPYLFMESNVDPKPLEQVSKETGVPIYKEHIYADEIGNKGDKVDTYIKFLEHNIRIIGEGLGD